MREINDYDEARREYYGPCVDSESDAEIAERKADEHREWLRQQCEKAAADTTEPATILMALVLDEGLPFGEAQAAYRRRFGADASLQDAAEREAA